MFLDRRKRNRKPDVLALNLTPTLVTREECSASSCLKIVAVFEVGGPILPGELITFLDSIPESLRLFDKDGKVNDRPLPEVICAF